MISDDEVKKVSVVKSLIQYLIAIGILATVIAFLFIIFEDSEEIKLLLKFFLFPGVLFVFIAGLSYDWFDRKMFARMQNRVGPRFIQPLYDLLKLLAKEDITADGVDKTFFDTIPTIQLILAFVVSFTVPVYIFEGLLSFEGDLIFVLFILALIGGSIFLLGWSSRNPYALLGSSRAVVAELSFEIPLALAFIGPAILAGSLRISEIASSGVSLLDITGTNYIINFIPLLVLFFMACLSATALLEKVPFDPAHAEVEIVGGWVVELSGKKYAFTKLANLILEFTIAGLIAAIFLGTPGIIAGPVMNGGYDVIGYLLAIMLFIIKTTFVVFLITAMRTLHSRLRIDQMVTYFWRYFLPICLVMLGWIIVAMEVF